VANFLDYFDPRNAPGINLFAGKAVDPVSQQALDNNSKGQFFDKNTIKGDARLGIAGLPGGEWLINKTDASQHQPSFNQLQQDPSSYPQFSSLIKQQPTQVTSATQPAALGQNPATSPLQAMLSHPMIQQWLGSLPQQ
jgi:hypothetical protein